MASSTSYTGIERDTPQTAGIDAETKAVRKLNALGFFVRRMDHLSPFDLIVADGKRVEVKYARPNNAGVWCINIHRHGVVSEKHCDFYLVLLDGVPGTGKAVIYLVIPAPLRKPTVTFSFQTLIRRWNQYVDNWSAFGQPKPRKNTHACLGRIEPAALKGKSRKNGASK